MGKPTILTVDDDPLVSGAITRDLRSRYGGEYRIVGATSGPDGLDVLRKLALRDGPVALIVADQRMPRMTGIEMLGEARAHVPGAKFLLLTAYADTDVAIEAVNDVGLGYYLLKPWDPAEERLYPVVDDLLGDWRHANPDHTSDVRVVGHRWSERSHEIKTFLARNHVPYRWYDVERDPEGQRLQALAGGLGADLPLVLVPDGDTLRAPTTLELAGMLGLRTSAQQPLYDVCIVGGGPAGLAAAVSAASEGLSTVIVEREAPGGQAGQSAAIENYLGFPKGLTGSDLTQRAVAQAARFGAEMVVARDVTGFEQRGPVRAVLLGGSGEIEARAVIVATGVSYRRLPTEGADELTGRGVYYGANAGDAAQCEGDDVYIVGAANSAGQAALNLARYAKRVVMVVRAGSLVGGMSSYLVERIAAAPNIDVRARTEVVAARGDGHLEALTLADRDSGVTEEVPAGWLFVFIGAAPHTEWLGTDVAGVLGAAAAPASVRELTGEPAAVAQFRATRAGSPSTSPSTHRRPALVKTAVASLFTAKVLTGVAVAAAATGGVALAAATDTLQGPLHGAAHSAAHAPALPGQASAAQVARKPSTSPTHDAEVAPAKPGAAASHATPSPSLTGLCTAYQAGVASNPGRALDNPAFAALITASGGKDKVAAYCTTKLAAHPTGVSSSHPDNRPTALPSSGHPTGPPSTIPAGPPAASPGPAPR